MMGFIYQSGFITNWVIYVTGDRKMGKSFVMPKLTIHRGGVGGARGTAGVREGVRVPVYDLRLVSN